MNTQRRQTTAFSTNRNPLGSLSLSMTNTRQSVLGNMSRMSILMKPTPSINRMTISNTSLTESVRRSHIGTKMSGKEDPRPIGDKAYVVKCCKSIIKYLSETKTYNSELSVKKLRSPMTRDFVNILEFLIRQLDPNFTLAPTVVKKNDKRKDEKIPLYEPESVIALFQTFGYPTSLSKRQLSSIGTPHTWPSVLAAITWIVELLRYNDELKKQGEDELSGMSSDSKMFFQYLAQSYDKYLMGSNEYTVMEDDMKKNFEEKMNAAEQVILKLTKEIEDAKQQIKTIETTEPPLVTLKNKKEIFLADCEKLKNLVAHREQAREKLIKRVAQEEQSNLMLQSTIKQLEREKDILKKQIASQPYSVEEVMKMNASLAKLEETLKTQNKIKEETRERLWQLESQCEELQEKMSNSIKDYNSLGTKLRMIPATAANADGRKLALEFSQNPQEMQTLMQEVIQNLKLVKETHTANVRAKQEELLNVQEKHQKMEEERQELAETIDGMQKKFEKMEQTFKFERENWRAALHQKRFDIEGMEQEIQKMKAEEQNDLTLVESEKTIDNLKDEINQKLLQHAREKELMIDILRSAANTLTRHKQAIQASVSNLEKKLKDTLNQLMN